jgi:hypothetical protein
MKRILGVSGLVLAGLLSACGGGGGGDDSDDPTYNAAAAWQALATPQATLSFRVTGVDSDGDTWIIDNTSTPVGPSTYQRTGVTGFKTLDRAVVAITGFPTETFDSETYYTAPGQIVGFRYLDSPDTCEDVVTTQPPTAARVGDSGPLYTSTEYSSCDLNAGTVDGTTTSTWSIKSISNTPYFCSLEQVRNASNVVLGTVEFCVQVATNGAIGPLVRYTITQPPDFSLVATGGP